MNANLLSVSKATAILKLLDHLSLCWYFEKWSASISIPLRNLTWVELAYFGKTCMWCIQVVIQVLLMSGFWFVSGLSGILHCVTCYRRLSRNKWYLYFRRINKELLERGHGIVIEICEIELMFLNELIGKHLRVHITRSLRLLFRLLMKNYLSESSLRFEGTLRYRLFSFVVSVLKWCS